MLINCGVQKYDNLDIRKSGEDLASEDALQANKLLSCEQL